MKSIVLQAKPREKDSVDLIRNSGRIPAVVYGHNVKNININLDYKDFQKTFKEAGESSLIELNIEGEKEKRLVLIHEFQRDHVSDIFTHIDFLQPSLTEEVQVEVPLVLEGVSLAVKELGGTLVKNIAEIEIKALPQNLPHEIIVNIDSLKTFEDHILAKDIKLPENVKLNIKPEEIVISVAKQTDIEAELETPIEEKVDEVEKVEKEKKEDIVDEGEEKAEPTPQPKEEKKEK